MLESGTNDHLWLLRKKTMYLLEDWVQASGPTFLVQTSRFQAADQGGKVMIDCGLGDGPDMCDPLQSVFS